jgi:hypothetical protein
MRVAISTVDPKLMSRLLFFFALALVGISCRKQDRSNPLIIDHQRTSSSLIRRDLAFGPFKLGMDHKQVDSILFHSVDSAKVRTRRNDGGREVNDYPLGNETVVSSVSLSIYYRDGKLAGLDASEGLEPENWPQMYVALNELRRKIQELNGEAAEDSLLVRASDTAMYEYTGRFKGKYRSRWRNDEGQVLLLEFDDEGTLRLELADSLLLEEWNKPEQRHIVLDSL